MKRQVTFAPGFKIGLFRLRFFELSIARATFAQSLLFFIALRSASVLNLNYIFFGYFDPKNIFIYNENKYFPG